MELNLVNRYILIFGLLITSSQLWAFDSLRTEETEGKFFVIHRVEKGETLYSLVRRYEANMSEVVSINNIENNQIGLFQELRIPISKPDYTPIKDEAVKEEVEVVTSIKPETSSKHVVAAGETLYAISRKYNVPVDQIKKWNDLSTNELSIGQELIMGEGVSIGSVTKVEKKSSEPVKKEVSVQKEEAEKLPEGFQLYFVQSGELLETIAAKFNVRPDSIVIWNDLPNTYLSIGQRLLIKGTINELALTKLANEETLRYGTRKKVKDNSGFIKVIEEGMARKIEDVETKKYLVMHRELPIGTLIEVRNLMNNQKIFARVVGKLPETGLNENVLIRLTPICFERLGVIDPQTRVEVSYYED
jgi:LysM repeat protein